MSSRTWTQDFTYYLALEIFPAIFLAWDTSLPIPFYYLPFVLRFPRETEIECQDLQWVSWRSRRADGVNSSMSTKEGEDRCPRQRPSLRESEFSFTLPYCSIQALNGLDEAHLHWGGQSAWFSLPFQLLISSRNSFIDISRIMFSPISWPP